MEKEMRESEKLTSWVFFRIEPSREQSDDERDDERVWFDIGEKLDPYEGEYPEDRSEEEDYFSDEEEEWYDEEWNDVE